MLLRVGTGVGAGLVLEGALLHGHRSAAGEIGHVVVDPDGAECACGRRAAWRPCWPRPQLRERLAARRPRGAGRGRRPPRRVLAPVVGTLNLHELVLSGPPSCSTARCSRRRPHHPRAHDAGLRRGARGQHVRAGRGTTSCSSAPPCSCWPVSWGCRDEPAGTTQQQHTTKEHQRCALKNTHEVWARPPPACSRSDSACPHAATTTTAPPRGGGPETAEIRVWLNGTDTPDAARDWLKTTFEDQHPARRSPSSSRSGRGSSSASPPRCPGTPRRPTSSRSATPRRRRSPTAGAFSDLSDDLDALGGDDLLPGFVEGAQVDGKTYAVPYYAGSKYIFYRKDLFEQAGIAVPTTMDEFVQAAIDLKKANPEPANFSGFWFPGQDWRNGVAFVWDAGGDLAVKDGDEWTGRAVDARVDHRPRDRPDPDGPGLRRGQGRQRGDPQTPFCAGEVGMISAPGWVKGLIEDPETGCPDMVANARRLRAARHRRRSRAGAARRLGHRDLGQVEEPGPGQGRDRR